MPIFVFNFPNIETPEVKKQIKKPKNSTVTCISPKAFEAKQKLLENFEKNISTMKDADITSEQVMGIIKKYYNV